MASNFQTKIKTEFRKRGYTVLKVIKLSDNGYPDLLCLKKNCKNIWIESKEAKDDLKPLQELRIKQLIELDNIAFCLKQGKGVTFGSDDFKKDFELW